MKLTAVTMVRDEADVIGDVIRHLATEGVTLIGILDNGSTDKTHEQILRARRELGASCTVVLKDDPEVGYYQSRKITELLEDLNATFDLGWVIPFDADELWHADKPLAEFFAEVEPDIDVVDAQLLSHFATGIDDAKKRSVFRRFEWRDPDVAPLPKIAFRWEVGAEVHQGAHGVTFRRRGQKALNACLGGSQLRVRHFPYRSVSQFIRKARNGAQAYAATDLPLSTGDHWRRFGRILDELGEVAMAGIYHDRYFFERPADHGQVHDPAPFCRWGS